MQTGKTLILYKTTPKYLRLQKFYNNFIEKNFQQQQQTKKHQYFSQALIFFWETPVSLHLEEELVSGKEEPNGIDALMSTTGVSGNGIDISSTLVLTSPVQ